MAYQSQFVQLLFSTKKTATVLLTVLPMVAVFSATTSLTGCGFHLRGYDTPLHFEVAKTAVIIEDNRTSFPLKLPLIQSLKSLGVAVVDGVSVIESPTNKTHLNNANTSNLEQIATININNVRFQSYELIGVLTEIRLVLSADVTYNTYQNGQPVTLTNLIQVERSYQYNEASVSTDDQQGSQIREWLYASLARRVTDQYVAISLPKVSSATIHKSSQPLKPSIETDATTLTPLRSQ